LKGGRARLSTLQFAVLAAGYEPIAGPLAGNWSATGKLLQVK